jgi:hypothetical protein
VNKKYSCIAQKVLIVAVSLFALWPTAAWTCAITPSKPIEREFLEKIESEADIIFIGRLLKYDSDKSNPTSIEHFSILRVLKPVKNANKKFFKLLGLGHLNCDTVRRGSLVLYLHIPARKPPQELYDNPPIGKMVDLDRQPVDPEYEKAFYRHSLLQQYGESQITYLLQDETGKFFPDDAKLIKEKFGYEITQKPSGKVPSP